MEEEEEKIVLLRQEVYGKYVNVRKLCALLKEKFGVHSDGKGRFRVQLRQDRYTIWVPSVLSEAEMDMVTIG
jgi:hypothetical protein